MWKRTVQKSQTNLNSSICWSLNSTSPYFFFSDAAMPLFKLSLLGSEKYQVPFLLALNESFSTVSKYVLLLSIFGKYGFPKSLQIWNLRERKLNKYYDRNIFQTCLFLFFHSNVHARWICPSHFIHFFFWSWGLLSSGVTKFDEYLMSSGKSQISDQPKPKEHGEGDIC